MSPLWRALLVPASRLLPKGSFTSPFVFKSEGLTAPWDCDGSTAGEAFQRCIFSQ